MLTQRPSVRTVVRAECVGGNVAQEGDSGCSAGPGGHIGWGVLGQSALGLFHMPEWVGGGDILPHSEALGGEGAILPLRFCYTGF